MMTPYSEYKESRVPWLGKIPSHWKLLPCRAIVENQVEKNDSGEIEEYLSLMANIGVVRYEEKGDVGNKKPEDLTKCKLVKQGNLVINSMNYAIGSYGMSPFNGVCSPVYIVLEPKEQIVERRYALRLFENKPMQKHLAQLGNGILQHRAAIKWDDIKPQAVPVPPLEEQRAILYFLDRETQRIDSLIEEKQTFIKLLREKRRALISHLVTKGLNPNVEMQDSGIEWIGQVPKHWVCPSYRYVCEIYRGKFTHRPRNDPAMFDGIHPFIQTGDVARAKNIISSYSQTLSDAGTEVSQLIPKGTLMMVITGAKIGSTAVLGFDSYAPDSVVGFKAKPTIELSYLKYSLMAALPALEQTSIQSTQPNLNIDRIGSLKTPLPPLDEQVSIVNYIENQLSNFETVLSAVEDSIKLLLERRTSLISAAVTGKIDVREAV